MQNIIVFCGARMGKSDKYKKLTVELSRGLAEKGKTIIYGGASGGLMGTVADEAMAAGGKVIGVIPKNALIEEVAHLGLSELIKTEGMHERKQKMYDAGDMAVVLPGGSGSLDEFFEFLVWLKLGIHQKPLVLFNAFGYYDPLIQMLDKMVNEGFMGEKDSKLYTVVNSIEEFWTFLVH